MAVSNEQIEAFKREIVEVSRKHGLSLAHEDNHGAFLVQGFREENIEWLMQAQWEDRW